MKVLTNAHLLRRGAVVALVWALHFNCGRIVQANDATFVLTSHDPFGLLPFTGTRHPDNGLPLPEVLSARGVPGFFNGMSGGTSGGAAGDLAIYAGFEPTQLTAVAIHVTDAAGASHSLSSLNDPALADVLIDLGAPLQNGNTGVSAIYPYAAAPSEFSSVLATLSAGETANGGQPFDLLFVSHYDDDTPLDYLWNISFAGEIGNMDGITALSVTDIGAIGIPSVPEPATTGLAAAAAVILMFRRHRR